MKFLPATSTFAAAAVVLAGSLMMAAPADAASSVTVHGRIECINHGSPVGVWVEAEKSTSGWATTKVPTDTMKGIFSVDYSYTLNKGGRYKVNVGCGGTSKKWGTTLKSDYLSGSTNNLVCNDVNPVLKAIWDGLAKKALGSATGSIAAKLELTQGIKYQQCGKK